MALLYEMFSYVYVTFPCGVLGQVWYLIVSIRDLCILPYFYFNISYENVSYVQTHTNKYNFERNFRNTTKISNSLDSDRARYIGPDLDSTFCKVYKEMEQAGGPNMCS